MGLPHLAEYNAATAASMKLRNAEGGRDRKWLRANGYRCIARHNDLLPWGMKILTYLNPTELKCVFEYCPVNNYGKQTRNLDRQLERVTAMTYEEQVWIHAYIGAPVQEEISFEPPKAR